MNDMGFKVAGQLRRKGAISSPPAGIVVKHPNKHGNRLDIVPAMCLHQIISVWPIKECFKVRFEFRMQCKIEFYFTE